MAKKTISIFGCTGSVGTTTLDIIRENKEQFEVKVLTANKNIDDLILFANEFNPESICYNNESELEKVKNEINTDKMEPKIFGGGRSVSCRLSSFKII